MSTDLLIAVLSLAGLQVGLIAWLRSDIRRLDDRLLALEHSQAKLEGLLEGLREAIVARAT